MGYVGRLAPEKRVDLLWQVAGLPGVRLVIVGDGPARASLEAELPGAVFDLLRASSPTAVEQR